MSDYKNSLLMPTTDFEMKGNLNQKEPLIQKKWLEDGIFQKVLAKNKGKTQFNLHDGPPYANGNIHVGHALNKTLKDIVVRYKNQRGFYADYIAGWDTHGLPIENAISKIDKDFENSTMSPVQKRAKCREYALNQVANQKEQFRRLGLITDFQKCYLTLEQKFVINELNLFKKMVEKGLVFQDFKPVYWSWSTRCALAEAEIEYDDEVSPSIYVAFKLVDEDAYAIIWTTTPWTIPSNLAIAVNPNFEYVYVKANNKTYIVGKALLETTAKELGWEKYEVIKTVSGKQLENKKYTHPFIKRTSPIILAEYVSDTGGTGLVHNAPGFGQDDYYACKKYNIDVYCPIDDFGKYNKDINDSELEGMFYLKANSVILERLTKCNALLGSKEIKHSVAHDWRTHKPIIYRATKQWFVNISKSKDEICNSLNTDVSTLNKKTIQRIIEMIENRQEWCISRQRVWGVPIPMLFDENYNPIYDIKVIEHIISIIDKEGVDVWFEKDAKYFVPNWLDQKKTYYKEKDILDVWFDSGSSFNVLKENGLNYPADLYLEGSDQFRGWFNSSAINGTIQNGHVPYKFLLQHGFVLDEKGFKMSKSKGNVVDPLKVCEIYGADILRLWVASSEYSIDLRFGDNIIKQITEVYRKLRNTLLRYSLSNLHDFDYDKHFTQSDRLEDKYVLYRLKQVMNEVTKAYDEYNFIDVTKAIVNYTNELSQWYFDLIKDELYCDEQNSKTRRQIQSTLFIILRTLSVALNPIIPHTCEELYSFFKVPNKQDSIALEEWPDLSDIKEPSKAELELFNKFFDLKDKVYQVLETARKEALIKKNNEATVYLVKDFNLDDKIIAKWLNVARVVSQDKGEIKVVKENLCKCERCWNYFEKSNMASDELCNRCNKVIK